jgi:hypothetical protein
LAIAFHIRRGGAKRQAVSIVRAHLYFGFETPRLPHTDPYTIIEEDSCSYKVIVFLWTFTPFVNIREHSKRRRQTQSAFSLNSLVIEHVDVEAYSTNKE